MKSVAKWIPWHDMMTDVRLYDFLNGFVNWNRRHGQCHGDEIAGGAASFPYPVPQRRLCW